MRSSTCTARWPSRTMTWKCCCRSPAADPIPSPRAPRDLKEIVASATEHLKVGLAALIIPERGIAVVHSSGEAPLRYLVARQGAPASAVDGADAPRRDRSSTAWCCRAASSEVAYRVLACPIARADGRCVGVLALFRAESAPGIHAAPRAADRTAGATRRRGAGPQLRRADRTADAPGVRAARAPRARSEPSASSPPQALLERAVHRHQSPARHQRQLRHAHGRSRDRASSAS